MPARCSVTKAWLRAPIRNCASSRRRKAGTTATDSATISASAPSTTRVSGTEYQNMMARKTKMKGRSSASVTAAPAMNSRTCSMPCRRAVSTPVGRCSKKRKGRRTRRAKMAADSTASMRLPVCSTSSWRSHDSSDENTVIATRPRPSATSVLCVRCTTTLSTTACVASGTASASNWITSDVSSTSRHSRRWGNKA